ncbi:HNH endonuclease signature motif containing protein [Cryobacterium sp. Hb1]|uniref:HNH endonuclease signature motif containing protein n=1 Tax=Cryobacterium sp. Hb1 TaxID=1259147 RepID=UPI00106AE2B5|nr:HNH endonuclease signature motif containing protein [Cryobacterium sp. Hb1]TFD72250.1 HNH endonuclease [Cryobacterium sp. Hb1]
MAITDDPPPNSEPPRANRTAAQGTDKAAHERADVTVPRTSSAESAADTSAADESAADALIAGPATADALAAENAAADARSADNAAARAEWVAEMAAAGIVPGKPPPTRRSAGRKTVSGVQALHYVVAASLQDWKSRPADTEQVRLLDAVRECDRAINRAYAARAAAIDGLAQWVTSTAVTGRPVPRVMLTQEAQAAGDQGRPLQRWSEKQAAEEGLVAELSCLLRVHENTARNLLCTSRKLQHNLPATRAELEAGLISYRHVEVIVDNALSLPDDAWVTFETEVLAGIENLTVGQLKKRAITVRELSHPESIVTRHKKALSQRCFFVMPARDGMACLELTLSQEDAAAISDRVDTLARSLHNAAQQDPVDTRTLGQQRLDVAVDLLLTGVTETGLGAGVQGLVNVTVPVLTLMGLSDEPGTLDGFGPIDAKTVRRVAATAKSFTRILIHPETSAVLSVGKTRYKVPADLKKWLEIRDGTCRFPGCTRQARHSEIDHTHDWQYNGETRWDNLAHLCKRGHRLKTESGWTARQTADGVLHWTCPAGKHYATHPATRLGPHSASRERDPAGDTAPRPVDVWAELANPHPDSNSTPF